MGLTPKQQLFVSSLLAEGFNLTAAAKRAGYAVPMQEGSRLMRNAVIQDALAAKLQPLLEQYDIDSQDVLEELKNIGFQKITDYVRWNDDGDSYMIPSQDLTLEQVAAIKKVQITTTRTDLGKAEDGTMLESVSSTIRLELHDKIAALRVLAQATRLVDEFGDRGDADRFFVIMMPEQTEGLPAYVGTGKEVELEENPEGAFALTAGGPT